MRISLRASLFVAAALALPACNDDPRVENAPPNFTMTSPANTAIGVSGTPTLSWSPSIGATSYRAQISTDPTFTTLAPVPGDFTLVGPQNTSIGVSTRPTFEWNPSLGAGSYRLQVSGDSGFGTLLIDQPGLTTTSVTPTAVLTPSTIYFWRVLAESDSAVTATGAPWSFTTAVGAAPTSFNLVSPAAGTTQVAAQPTYVWTSSSGASSYRLEVSTDPDFQTTAINLTGIPTTSVTPSTTLQPFTAYYWRVSAVNASGTKIATTTPLTFRTGS
ncbi:MAG TPA: hypothetical protein VM222_04765 [Planctomycetota bacterium]|nr:hypothetical protein [Planctomycetota bacterium]